MSAKNKTARRFCRSVWAVAHALLLCIFAWNQWYVPVHLAGHEHTEARAPHREAFGVADNGHADHDDHDSHEPHPASDHLSGYISHADPGLRFDVVLVSSPAVVFSTVPALSLGQVPSPPARGPPPSFSFPA